MSMASEAGLVQASSDFLPDILKQATEQQAPMEERTFGSYITFAHPKRSDEWAKIVGKYGQSVQEGDMYLMHEGEPTRLEKAKVSILCGHQYWVEKNAAGNILRTSKDEKPKPFKEQVDAVLLLYREDDILPVSCQFRTVKCSAAVKLTKELVECQQPEWVEKSLDHAAASRVQQPFMRFYGEISEGEKRISKSSGLAYRPLNIVIKPTGAGEWALLKQLTEGTDTRDQLKKVAETYQYRMDTFKDLLKA